MSTIWAYILQFQEVLGKMSDEPIASSISLLFAAWKQRKQVFILGNGGSAATASHMANDLCKATIVSGKPRLRAIALTDCISLITALANDISYDSIFKEQLENLMNRGDVVLGISASGNSPNVLRAMEYARTQGAITIAWTGQSGGKLKDIVDLCVHSPSDDVGVIESVHVLLDHLVTNELLHRIRDDGKTWERLVELVERVPFFADDIPLARGIRSLKTDLVDSPSVRRSRK
jgi:D-sedoheptulose 7-phosphate isomerase